MKLEGKVALVTGAGRGIGKEIALAYAREGAKVGVNDETEEQAGTIAVGSDADLTIWDPDETRPVDSQRMQTNADFSPYEGWTITGWPSMTISRGEVVSADGDVVGRPGRGELLIRGPCQML